DADGAHRARVAQLAHRAVAAVEELLHSRCVSRAMGQAADIVAEQDVHSWNAETREAFGVRTQDGVVAIVEHRRIGSRRKIAFATDRRILRARGHERAADLGGDRRSRLRAGERGAETRLAQAEAIERRGVEQPYAGSVCSPHRGERILVGQLAVQVADAGRAETEHADFEPGVADRARRQRAAHAVAVAAPAAATSRRDFHANNITTAKQIAGTSMAMV